MLLAYKLLEIPGPHACRERLRGTYVLLLLAGKQGHAGTAVHTW